MELNNIECISDITDEDEIHRLLHPQFASSKPQIHPTTSVHELLECPVCTNSMYPPIHQVCSFLNLIKGKGLSYFRRMGLIAISIVHFCFFFVQSDL